MRCISKWVEVWESLPWWILSQLTKTENGRPESWFENSIAFSPRTMVSHLVFERVHSVYTLSMCADVSRPFRRSGTTGLENLHRLDISEIFIFCAKDESLKKKNHTKAKIFDDADYRCNRPAADHRLRNVALYTCTIRPAVY